MDALELVANEQLVESETSDIDTSSEESSEAESSDKTDDDESRGDDFSSEFKLKLKLEGNNKSDRAEYKPKIELLD